MLMRSVGLSDEQRLFVETTRAFVDDRVLPWIREHRDDEWLAPPEERVPWQLVRAADEIGLRTLAIPERWGGVELAQPAQTLALVAEEISRGDVGLADILTQVWKVSVLLGSCAPEHLQAEWFPRIVEDPTFLLAHALTEPRGASDRWLPYNVPEAAMETRAVQDGGEWVITGRKQFISNGFDAKLYVVYANTDRAAGVLDGTSSFLVPRDTPGFLVGPVHEKIGARLMNNSELAFDDCRVPADHLLVANEALKKARVYFRAGKILVAAKNLGTGVGALEETSRYVQEHVQGGRVLIEHQIVAAHVADMATKVEAARAFVRYAARALDEGAEDADALCLMAKVHTAELVFDVARRAVELHGGSGAMREAGVEKHLRDASIGFHTDGTNDIHRFKIAKALFPKTAGRYAGTDGAHARDRSTQALGAVVG
jgi:alkylation response protein AidB-like acyl-CoA dehydrogenase